MFKIKGVPILVVIHIIKFLVTAPRTPITIGTTNIIIIITIIIIIIVVVVVVVIMPNVSQSTYYWFDLSHVYYSSKDPSCSHEAYSL